MPHLDHKLGVLLLVSLTGSSLLAIFREYLPDQPYSQNTAIESDDGVGCFYQATQWLEIFGEEHGLLSSKELKYRHNSEVFVS